jgi:endonuclease YncB( thermonuclease family)
MLPRSRRRAVACIGITATLLGFESVSGQSPKPETAQPQAQPRQTQERQRQPQTRPHGKRIAVPPASLRVDDGDTFGVVWAPGDTETVRILGIDTPETRHDAHNIPEDQPYGPEARAFARGAVTFADKVELIRFATLDPYGRTLGYFFLDGRNYSAAVVTAHLAYESVSHYGDNGFPEEAKAVLDAAKAAGTPPFEPPHEFRRRMREQARGAGKP